MEIEEGYYWVRHYHQVTIAEYLDTGDWQIMGSELFYDTSDIEVIERIKEPNIE